MMRIAKGKARGVPMRIAGIVGVIVWICFNILIILIKSFFKQVAAPAGKTVH